MKASRPNNFLSNVVIFFAVTVLTASVLYFSGCAPTAKQVAPPPVDEARQKAIADSLFKIYSLELNKAWSTGYEYYKNKTYRSAINPFWKVIEIDTINRFKEKYTYLADSYIKLNVPDSAQIVLELGVKAYPQNAYLHRTLAYFYDGRGQVEDAIREYEAATNIDPKQVNDWKALGSLYVKKGETDKAIAAYEKVVSLDPKDQDSQRVLSKLYKSTGDASAAIQRMEEVKKLDPKNVENLFNLGREYFNLSDFDNAVANFEQLLQIKSDDVSAMEYLGNALQNKGSYTRAISIYKEIVKLQPNNKKVLTDMATSYKELKQFSTARNYARQALQIDPKYGLAFIVIGEIYEAAAENCYTARGKKSAEFDDKLIYDLAYQQYQKAAEDLQFKDYALKRMSYVNELRPTKEDLFFHRGQTKPKDTCYQWIYQ